MIGCDGPTLTVRVFSESPLEEVTSICADTDSHTSVVLCRLLFRRLFGRDVRIVPFDARERVAAGASADDVEHPPTVLLIGDKVVTDPTPTVRYPHQLDLGEAWKKETGLPFVYAAWACRAAEASSPKVRGIAALLDRQRRHNRTRLDWIAATRGPAARWPTDLAGRYLGKLLRYELGPREREAVTRFHGLAREAGFLPHKDPVVWADGPGD
jgi:predicted solute-binding protein